MSRLRPKRTTGRLKRGGAEERRTRSSGDEIGVQNTDQLDAERCGYVGEKVVAPSQMRAAACDNDSGNGAAAKTL